jgi:putative thioredoxin
MADAKSVYDVNDQNFYQAVMVASNERPVIVDFWAPWCGPCRILGPLLDKIVASLQGRAVLAKVNVDQNPQLAAQWRIMGIPAVKVFVNGQVAAEFVGALPEREIRRALEPVLPRSAATASK